VYPNALQEDLSNRKESKILKAARPLEGKVKLLIGIHGVTPPLALAFLSEVGDITRFRSARRLHSYLGMVPTVRSSGGVTRNGVISRRSRTMTRSLFTQAVIPLVDSSHTLARFYRELVARKGYGRARIALLRKIFSLMRPMLLARELYRWTEPKLYEKKLSDYAKEIKKGKRRIKKELDGAALSDMTRASRSCRRIPRREAPGV
jgi:hypothetical protein